METLQATIRAHQSAKGAISDLNEPHLRTNEMLARLFPNVVSTDHGPVASGSLNIEKPTAATATNDAGNDNNGSVASGCDTNIEKPAADASLYVATAENDNNESVVSVKKESKQVSKVWRANRKEQIDFFKRERTQLSRDNKKRKINGEDATETVEPEFDTVQPKRTKYHHQ